MLPRSTFVLGGAASGKSSWAEELLKNDARPMVYLATGHIFDDEVAANVEASAAALRDAGAIVESVAELLDKLKNEAKVLS